MRSSTVPTPNARPPATVSASHSDGTAVLNEMSRATVTQRTESVTGGRTLISGQDRLLGRFALLEHQHVDAKRLDQLLQLIGRPGEHWERAVMHRHDLFDAEKAAGCGGGRGIHREMAADREER